MLRKIFLTTLMLTLSSGLTAEGHAHGRKFLTSHGVVTIHRTHPTPPGHATIRMAPPALRREVIPPRPARWAVWIPGHWVWNYRAGCWVWSPGYWHRRPRGVAWVPGYWQKRSGVWIWIEGHWRL